jgi:RHS repeat-associated protein
MRLGRRFLSRLLCATAVVSVAAMSSAWVGQSLGSIRSALPGSRGNALLSASVFARPRREGPDRTGRLTSARAGWSSGRSSSPPVTQLAVRASAGTPTVPFTECPAVGFDTSCGLLIDVTNVGLTVLQDPSQGPYDGGDDTLVGVINQSNKTLGHLFLASDDDIFGFDGDGICAPEFDVSPGCPFGPTGYEGPGTSFAEISPDDTSGVVSFTNGVAPGGTAYFSLEEALTSSSVVSGGPSLTEQGGAPNGSEHRTTCSAGAPVNCASGTFWHEFTDAEATGVGVPLKFTRTYSSSNAATDGPLGFGWSDSYDMSLNIDSETGAATIHEESGSTVTFPSDGEGQFLRPARVLATVVHNEDGTFSFTRFSSQIEYLFSESGQLLREVDRSGNKTILTYTGGLLTKVAAPSGRSLTFTYAGSHIHTVTDPAGRTTTFSYDPAGDLTGTTDALSRSWAFNYGPTHLLLGMTDPRGGTTTNTYDGAGRVVSQEDPAGRTTTWQYEGDASSPEGGTTTLTDPRGDLTVYEYDNLELRSVTHGAGTTSSATTSYSYDSATLGVATLTNPDGDVTRNNYDEDGNLVTTTDPLGRTSTYTYNALNEVTTATDPNGTNTSYTYSTSGNLLETSTPLEETGELARTSYSYEAQPGEVTAVTDPDGHVAKYGYDGAGDRASITDPDGHVTTFVYNGDGQPTTKTTPGGHATSYAYDASGQLTTETDPLGHATSYEYDADGNRTKITDANGHTTQQSYDADNELTQVTRPDGSALNTSFDPAGNMTSQTDAAGHVTSYRYDPLDQLVSTTDPDGHTTSDLYDAAGRKTAMIDPEGNTTDYFYDEAGQLTNVFYSDGRTPSISDRYDADGNRIEMNDGSGTSTFAYDSLNRLISTTDGSGATVDYGYDLAGHVTTLTYPNGKNVTRGYDAAGNLTSVTDWLGHTTHFGYDVDTNLDEAQYPGGVTTHLSHDGAERIAGITDTGVAGTLASFSYNRDPIGQVTSETADNGETTTTKYTRDALDQVTAAGETPYAYDAADNPTTFGSVTQTFDPANELRSSSGPGESPSKEATSEEPRTSPSAPVQPPTAPIPPATNLNAGGPPSGGVGGFHSTQPARSPTVDSVVHVIAQHGRKIVTPRLRTTRTNDLVVAFVSMAGRSHVAGIAGDHLRWSRLARQHSSSGDVEAWRAQADTPLSGPITVHSSGGAPTVVTVAAFSGAGTHIAGSAVSRGKNSTPESGGSAAAGDLVWAVGHSTGQPHPTAPHNGQRIVAQIFSKAGRNDGWVQDAIGSAASAQIADTVPAKQWTLLAITIASSAAHSASISRHHATVGRVGNVPRGAATGIAGPHVRPNTTETLTRHFSYDPRGDRTEETNPGGPSLNLRYDQADRLIAAGAEATYSYNGDGLRVSKTVSSITTTFVWNQAEPATEVLQAGAIFYVYGPQGQPIEQITAETPTYLHTDQQGSVRLITDGGGAVVGRYDYNAWGAPTRHGGAASSLQYDGQYTDGETGFQYLRARYYDPATGQFVTQDPAFILSDARYGFANDDPLTFSDPTGQWFGIDTLLGTAIGAVVGTVSGAGAYGVSVLAGSDQFSWRQLGASTVGGLVGGAAAGACEGTTWVGTVACGAGGGAIGAATTQWLSGQQVTPGGVLAGGLLGAVGGAAGKLLFPLRGFVPYKLINVIEPGINSLRLYGQNAIGGLVNVIATGVVCWW